MEEKCFTITLATNLTFYNNNSKSTFTNNTCLTLHHNIGKLMLKEGLLYSHHVAVTSKGGRITLQPSCCRHQRGWQDYSTAAMFASLTTVEGLTLDSEALLHVSASLIAPLQSSGGGSSGGRSGGGCTDLLNLRLQLHDPLVQAPDAKS